MYETLSKSQLNAMTSEGYKAAFEGANGDDFRKRVSELELQPTQASRPRGNVRGPESAATPASTSFDPSFDEQPPAVPAAAAPAQPATVPGQLLVWEYQPTDAQNRPLGGVQRFKYDPSLPATDPMSLASQLTKSNIHVRRMANERKIEAIIDSVKTVATGYSEPQFLTPDQHPNADAINELTRNAIVNGTLSAMNVFKQNHPEFVLGEANAVSMTRFEALKAYSLGQKAYREKSPAAALPYHQRAIELDPNFAISPPATCRRTT
jgi:hypothetical protein